MSALCLQAPQKQIGELPSLMIKAPEEDSPMVIHTYFNIWCYILVLTV